MSQSSDLGSTAGFSCAGMAVVDLGAEDGAAAHAQIAVAALGRFAEDLAALCDLGLPLRVVLDMARLSDAQLELAVELEHLLRAKLAEASSTWLLGKLEL